MSKGILLFGAMGVGDTTLGKAVAEKLGYPHIDLDDYHWRWDTEIPYTVFRSREERIESIMAAVSAQPHFVMSGSMWSIRKTFEPFFDLAVFLTAPAKLRAERLCARSIARWGERVLPGGDMYESSQIYRDYRACAEAYEQDIRPQACRLQHEQWAEELPCPVLRLNGAGPIAENADLVVRRYLRLLAAQAEQSPK